MGCAVISAVRSSCEAAPSTGDISQLGYYDCLVDQMKKRVIHAVCSEKSYSVNSLCRRADHVRNMVRYGQTVADSEE